MIVNINNKKIKIKECISFKDRLLGFMFKKNFDYGLLFNNCNCIHTFFMRECIDVIALDSNNNIIKYCVSLKPNRIFRCSKASKIIELPKNTIKSQDLKGVTIL